MLFTDIRLQNYRSYGEASFELGSGVNIVVGPNAAGKTNLLEALMVSAVGKSFRAKDGLLLRSGETWLRLDVHTTDNQTRVVKIASSNGKTDKTFEFDDKSYKRMTPKNIQPIVLFEPDDLRLLHAEPKERREYIDDVIEQYASGFSKLRIDLRRVVAQRNALLKQPQVGQSQLFAWNIRLSDIASQVVKHRIELVEEFQKNINKIYTSISGKKMNIALKYNSKTNTEDYSSSLMKQLEQTIDIDRLRGFTSRGPHRDDMLAYFGDTLLSDAASRGENRTYILCLKILELQILEEKTGKRPLLLLDDVFSELDGSRRRALTNFLEKYQTVITTTDADIVLRDFDSKPNIIPLG